MSSQPWALGVDIGGTRVSAGLVSGSGELVHLEREPTPRHEGAQAVLARLLALSERALAQSEARTVVGIGIGFGGPVDFSRQRVRYSHHVAGWSEADPRQAFAEKFDLPVLLENDANAGGLGETVFGAAKGSADVLYINIGTGVGGAVIIDGRVHHGANSNAGEFGHIVLEPDGPLCTCGKRGCVEALCSGDALGRMAREKDRAGSSLEQLEGLGITGRTVGERAAAGDELSLRLVRESAGYMGRAIAGAANLLDPDVVVIGGGVSEMGETYLAPVREAFRACAMGPQAENTRILAAQFGYDAGVIGAAAIIFAEHTHP